MAATSSFFVNARNQKQMGINHRQTTANVYFSMHLRYRWTETKPQKNHGN